MRRSWTGAVSSLARQASAPPWRDRRFWLIQLLVILMALLHVATHEGGPLPRVGVPHFATMALFLVPIVYAALNFGLSGSLATALWVTLLMAPDLNTHSGLDLWANGIQLAIIDVVAVFVGQRVERERDQRRRADAARRKYSALFESNQAPVLVLEVAGGLREANAAARALFALTQGGSGGQTLADLVGKQPASALLGKKMPEYLTVRRGNEERIFKSLRTSLRDEDDAEIVELVLQDVTAERLQQRGAKEYAAYVLKAQESERRRIAAELHDEPLQSSLQLARKLADMESCATAAGEIAALEQVRALADGIAADLRRMARGLRPPALDDLGVGPAIRMILKDFEARTGTETEFRVAGDVRRLAPDVELCLFRIAQEALHNVERHARARQAAVKLTFGPREVRLLVADDGIGFETAAPRDGSETGSLGLLGMRERAAMLGGRFALHSSPGRGSTLRVVIPDRADATEWLANDASPKTSRPVGPASAGDRRNHRASLSRR